MRTHRRPSIRQPRPVFDDAWFERKARELIVAEGGIAPPSREPAEIPDTRDEDSFNAPGSE